MPLRTFVIHETKTVVLTRVWKKFVPHLSMTLEGLKTSVEEVTANVLKIAREAPLEAQPLNVDKSFQFHYKSFNG
jgi:hypothetical protein